MNYVCPLADFETEDFELFLRHLNTHREVPDAHLPQAVLDGLTQVEREILSEMDARKFELALILRRFRRSFG